MNSAVLHSPVFAPCVREGVSSACCASGVAGGRRTRLLDCDRRSTMAHGFALVLLLLGLGACRVADSAAVGGIPIYEEVPLCSSLLEGIIASGSGTWSGDGSDETGLTDDEDVRQRPGQQRCDVTDIRCLIESGVILCRGNVTALPPVVTTLVERGYQSMWHNPAVILVAAVASCFAVVSAFIVVTLARHWRELGRHRANQRPRRLSSTVMTTPVRSKLMMV